MINSIKSFWNSKFVPTDKDFEAKGTLSPQQFMQAGDQLTNFGWKWQKSLHNNSKMLPDASKQYLVSAATSNTRIRQILEQQIMQQKQANEFGFVEVTGDDQIEQKQEEFRQYQIYISYDEYYYSPRLWIKGNDFNGKPLSSKQIFEDINIEYQNQTVTEQTSPFLECRMLTIHPCKHSEVLKRFVEESKAKGKKIKPHQSLIIFLKFMSSVMPTIRYDQAIDIEI